ncbi:RagB/SusD family nutrient uptake outer membrane protein [Hymenobacter crusticola]|nr:RagB/SusD family nutrient uptake outer membrane protein [Hymenobacter crusticola]
MSHTTQRQKMKFPLFRSTLAVSAVLAGLLGTTGCKDYLDIDPVAYSNTDVAFLDVAGATSTVIGAYDMLSGDTGYGTRVNLYYPYDSDEMQAIPGQAFNAGNLGIARYAALPVNNEITNPFNNLYQGIERANICIKYIPQMAAYTSGSAADTAALHRLYGEVLTLRAQYLFEAIRNWGDVPAPFVPAIDAPDVKLANADRNATYDRLIADLLQAEKLVPWRTAAGTTNERITKGAVKALRARLALYRGGYSLYGLEMKRQPDYLEYYKIARQECLELMAKRGEHTLNPSFENLWRSVNQLQFDPAREIIFEVAEGASSAASDSKLGYYNGPRQNASTTFGSSTGSIGALPTYFYAFDSTDLRRDITVTLYTIESNNQQKAVALTAATDGKFRRHWRTPALAGTGNYLGYNWPLIRFADVLLMFAEADNELNGPTAAALAAVQEVRNRGYGSASAAGARLTLPSSKAAMFDLIANERFLELGGEGIRKYDLIRWNLLSTKLAEAKTNLTALKNGTGRYANVPLTEYYRVTTNGTVQFARSFFRPAPATAPAGTTAIGWRSAMTDALIANLASEYKPNAGKELFPYPQGTIDTDPNVKQNAGY